VTAITTRKEPKNISFLGKVLILGTTLLLTMAIVLYGIKSRWLNPLFGQLNLALNSSNRPIAALENSSPDAEADLVNYMLEALPVIEKQEVNQQPILMKTGFPDTNLQQPNRLALPSTPSTPVNLAPTIALNRTTAPSQATNVVERIYIPVYRGATVHPSNNHLTAITPTAKTTFLPWTSPAKPKSNNLLPAPIDTPLVHQPQTNPRPLRIALPKLPVATAVVGTSLDSTRANISLPKYSAQLEGLLELGKKSAALFSIEGVTHRINTGENIGSSGWTLVEVSKGEAIIRRNGEVRSIYPGQKL
jgi:hypothetical protein